MGSCPDTDIDLSFFLILQNALEFFSFFYNVLFCDDSF